MGCGGRRWRSRWWTTRWSRWLAGVDVPGLLPVDACRGGAGVLGGDQRAAVGAAAGPADPQAAAASAGRAGRLDRAGADHPVPGAGPLVQRPRPFGVEFRTDWTGWALPSEQIAALVVVLVGILYGLVPEGRWRETGKWVATGLVALVAVAHLYLGVEAPTDVLVGVAVGVAVPLFGFRLFTPNELYPISYRRGRSAHLDVGGARGAAIRRALEDQLGLTVERVEPFGLAGSAGSTPLRITVKGDPPTLPVRQALRPQPPARRPLVQARPGAALRPAGGREAVPHRPPAGPAGGLRAVADATGRPAQPDAVRLRGTDPGAGVPAGHRVLRRRRPSWVRPRSTTTSSTRACRSSGRSGTPGWPTATSSRRTCWSATDGCC